MSDEQQRPKTTWDALRELGEAVRALKRAIWTALRPSNSAGHPVTLFWEDTDFSQVKPTHEFHTIEWTGTIRYSTDDEGAPDAD